MSSSTSRAASIYCRLPRAATACDVATFLPLANGTGRAAIMDRPDGTLLIVRATSDPSPDGTFRGTSFYRVSGDRGATWSPPTPFAYGSAAFSKVALMPGGQSVLTLNVDTFAARLQSAPLAGGESRTTALYDPKRDSAFADVTPLPDGRVVSIVGDLSDVQWSVFGGGDIYDPNAWPARGTLRRDLQMPRSSADRAGRSCSSTRRSPSSAPWGSTRRSSSARSTHGGCAGAPSARRARTAASSAPRPRSRTPAGACT